MCNTFASKTFAPKTFASDTFRGPGVVPPPSGGKRTFFCDTFASRTYAPNTFRGVGTVPPPPPPPPGPPFTATVRDSAVFVRPITDFLVFTAAQFSTVPPPPPTVYLQDDFAGTDGASIDSRPMNVGPGWSIASGGNSGGWDIDSGRAKETGALPITSSIAISDAGVSDAVVSGTVNVPAIIGDSAVGALARMSADFQNGWLGWVDVFDQRIAISERTSGFFVLRAQLPASLSYDTDYELAFDCTGSVLTLTVAGVGTLSFTSSANLTNTNFGIYGDSAPGQFVSSFIVTA